MDPEKLTRLIERHFAGFKELKPPNKPKLKKLLKQKVLVEGSINYEVTLKHNEVTKAENSMRKHENARLQKEWDEKEAKLAELRDIQIQDGSQIFFGSSHRCVRLKVPNVWAFGLVEESVLAGRLARLLDQSRAWDSTKVTLETKLASDLLSPFITAKVETAKVEIVGNEIKVHAIKSTELQSVKFEVGNDNTDPITFGINVSYFRNALVFAHRLGISEVVLNVRSPLNPVVLESEGFEYLIAPVRVNK